MPEGGHSEGKKAPLHPPSHRPGNRLLPGLQAAHFQSPSRGRRASRGGPGAGLTPQMGISRCVLPAGPREQLRPGPSRWGHAESSFTAETCVPRPPLSLGLQPPVSPDCWNPPAAPGSALEVSLSNPQPFSPGLPPEAASSGRPSLLPPPSTHFLPSSGHLLACLLLLVWCSSCSLPQPECSTRAGAPSRSLLSPRSRNSAGAKAWSTERRDLLGSQSSSASSSQNSLQGESVPLHR